MRTFIKIYGPPIAKAIRELEKIAANTPQVCIMDTFIQAGIDNLQTYDDIHSYFAPLGSINKERCSTMINFSGQNLGDFDFYFQWFEIPDLGQIHSLLGMIDEKLIPLGVMYNVVHSPAFDIEEKPMTDTESEETMAASTGPIAGSWARFEVFMDKAGKYRFRLKAPNHRIIASSEAYEAKVGALNGIKSVRVNAVIDSRFESFMDSSDHPRFRLRAANKEIIASSQAYDSRVGRDKGIQSVKRNAPEAELIDLTKN
jgi:uncharacterized protein YegP (UPF0339 family)